MLHALIAVVAVGGFPSLLAFFAPPETLAEVQTQTFWLLGVVLGILGIAYVVGVILRRRKESNLNPAVVQRYIHRIRVWWLMCAILVAGFMLGRTATIVLFGLVSFWALREFITMTPTRRADHRALFWMFFVVTPVQYILIATSPMFVSAFFEALGFQIKMLKQTPDFYGIYTVLIPIYAFLFIPVRSAFAGDPKRFLERTAKIQAGMFICVYALSHAPALLNLNLQTTDGEPWSNPNSHLPNAGLLFYFILIVQLSEVYQYAWGKLLGRRVIAPEVNGNRTWEGFLGGATTTALTGTLLWWATPFRVWEAACMSLIVSVMALSGGMVMSAIKRDRGIKDYGTLVQGHAGVLDRIDSLCFAAPVFFHLTRYFFSA